MHRHGIERHHWPIRPPRDSAGIAWKAQAAREALNLLPVSGAGWRARAIQLPDGIILTDKEVVMTQGQMPFEETQIAVEVAGSAPSLGVNLVFCGGPQNERLDLIHLDLVEKKPHVDIKLERVGNKPRFVRITPKANTLQFTVQELFPLG